MKKLEKRFILTSNSIIAWFLALLGFTTSCEKGGYPGGGIICMYGTPTATFIINGRVTSSESAKPIQSIRVLLPGDTTKTDIDGNYSLTTNGFPEELSISVSFQDIDGTLNGEFENLDTIVVFKDPKFINGDRSWYRGETSKEVNIKLTNKK